MKTNLYILPILFTTLSSASVDAQTSTWEVVLDSGFGGTEYTTFESDWNYLYPWGSDHNGSARMYASPTGHEHVYKDGSGILVLKASKIDWDEGNSSKNPFLKIKYHSGAIHAKHQIKITDTYPNYELEARIKAPHAKGTWPAFWLTGVNAWPPESDIMEYKGDKNCWQNTYTGSWQTKKTWVDNPLGAWHTYRVWITKVNDTDVDIHYYIDDVWKAAHRANFVNKAMRLIVNLQMEGSSGSPGPGGDTFYYIDYVRIGRTVMSDGGGGSGGGSNDCPDSHPVSACDLCWADCNQAASGGCTSCN